MLGHAATTGSPQRAFDCLGSQCVCADCARPRTCPRPPCGPAPLRLRLVAYDCVPSACLSRAVILRIGRGLRPRQRPRRHGGASAVLLECSAQSNETLRQLASPARPSALRTHSPGPLRGCGFRARPCLSDFPAGGRDVQGETLRKYGGASKRHSITPKPGIGKAGSTSRNPVSF